MRCRCFRFSRSRRPSSSTIELGPLSIHFYGLTLLVAIAAAVVDHGHPVDAARRRLGSHLPRGRLGRRVRDRRRAAVPRASRAGTSCRTSGGGRSRSGRADSASGAESGSAASSARSSRSARARPSRKLADCVAPALLVAQGIGRFGNWWNQELFGGPTDLPWGLEIDPENRPIEHVDQETFHPTFLYEALWCFAAAGVLLLVERPSGPDPARRAVRALRPHLQRRATLDRDAARRPVARARRRPAQRLRRRARDPALGGVLRLVAANLDARRAGAPPKVETMAVPKSAQP